MMSVPSEGDETAENATAASRVERRVWVVYGSASSVDIDLCVLLPDALPATIKERADLCKRLASELAAPSSALHVHAINRPLNVNIATLDTSVEIDDDDDLVVVGGSGRGVIATVHKGTADELNNAIRATFDHHRPLQMLAENPVLRRVDRDVRVKLERCARSVLGMFTRTRLREMIKKRINGGLAARIEALQQMDLSDDYDFTRKGCQPATEVWKLVAFQLAQTVALAELGVEVFSKEAAIDVFPGVAPFLRRRPADGDRSILERLKIRFVRCALKDIS